MNTIIDVVTDIISNPCLSEMLEPPLLPFLVFSIYLMSLSGNVLSPNEMAASKNFSENGFH